MSTNVIHLLFKTKNSILNPNLITRENAIQKDVSNLLSCLPYIKGLERLPFNILHLPLGPTEGHIEGMIRSGKIARENVWVGNNGDIASQSKTQHAPHIMGRKIEDMSDLEETITDKITLRIIKEQVGRGAKYPTVYVMNHESHLVYAEYMGGRIPTQDEQILIWDKISGKNVLEKVTHAGIPFLGGFNIEDCNFYGNGCFIYLTSNTLLNDGYKSLNVVKNNLDIGEGWDNLRCGYSSLVIIDKAKCT